MISFLELYFLLIIIEGADRIGGVKNTIIEQNINSSWDSILSLSTKTLLKA